MPFFVRGGCSFEFRFDIIRSVLDRTGRPAVSNLELYTRYTSVVWSSMHDMRMKPPPLAKRPSGVLLPPTNRSRTANLPSIKGSAEKPGIEVCLAIRDLQNTFLRLP